MNNILNPNQVLNWSTGDVTNNLTVVNSGHYWAQIASSKAGCSTTDSIWIARDCYINIPNAFSPDGDGLNDFFEINPNGLKEIKGEIVLVVKGIAY